MCVLKLKAKGCEVWIFYLFIYLSIWKTCCQINSQPLNLKVLLMARSGPSSLFIVALHLQLMELQKTMLLSFCLPTKSAGRLDNEKKQRRHLNSTLLEGDRGLGMEISLKVASFFHVWVTFIGNAQLFKLRRCWSLFHKKKISRQTYWCIVQINLGRN